MSTSEFESMPPEWEFDRVGLSKDGGNFPDDFSEEDFELVQELNALFSLDQEQIPPLFVQTLLAAEDPRLQPVEAGFEKKTSVHVFRRLQLKRQLFRFHRFSVRSMLSALSARCWVLIFLLSTLCIHISMLSLFRIALASMVCR